MVVFTVNWLVQESTSYTLGILSAHRTMAGAARALATAMEGLDILWHRTDRGLSPEQMRSKPPRSRAELHRYRASFIRMDEGRIVSRRIKLEINQLNVAN